LLKDVDQLFFWVTDTYEAVNDWKKDQCFISASYDASTHFESTTDEVLALHEAITGSKIDLTIPTDPDKLADPDSLGTSEEPEAVEESESTSSSSSSSSSSSESSSTSTSTSTSKS